MSTKLIPISPTSYKILNGPPNVEAESYKDKNKIKKWSPK